MRSNAVFYLSRLTMHPHSLPVRDKLRVLGRQASTSTCRYEPQQWGTGARFAAG